MLFGTTRESGIIQEHKWNYELPVIRKVTGPGRVCPSGRKMHCHFLSFTFQLSAHLCLKAGRLLVCIGTYKGENIV